MGAILARREDEDQGRAGPKGSRVASIRPHHLVDWLPKLFGDRIASVVVVDSSNRTLAIVPERLSIMALAGRGVAMLRPTRRTGAQTATPTLGHLQARGNSDAADAAQSVHAANVVAAGGRRV